MRRGRVLYSPVLWRGVEMGFSIQRPNGRALQVCAWVNGRWDRVSAGTEDETVAEEKRRDAEAAHRMGLDWKQAVKKGVKKVKKGDLTEWREFREEYRGRLPKPRPDSWRASEDRLNLVESCLSPKIVRDVCNREALGRVRDYLLRKYPSKHSAKSRFHSILAALRWAVQEGYAEAVPLVKGISVAKIKKMKGRPLTPQEFKQYLAAAYEWLGDTYAGWEFLIKGVKAQGLRLDENFQIHWTDPHFIRPVFTGKYPRLEIPANLQKNDTEEDVPMTPDMADLLQGVPKAKRQGWVFDPPAIRHSNRSGRNPDWAGKVLAKVGKLAGIQTDKKKFASAHDLRRTCAQDMMDAGCDEADIMRVMRHADWETTRSWYASKRVEKSAEDIHKKMRARSQTRAHKARGKSA